MCEHACICVCLAVGEMHTIVFSFEIEWTFSVTLFKNCFN